MSSPLWEKCLSHLEGDLSAQQLNTWLRPLQAIETEDSLRLLAPNPYVKAWVQEQLEQQINSLILALSQGAINKVDIEVGTKSAPVTKKSRPAETIASADSENSATPVAKAEPAIGSPMNLWTCWIT